MLTSDAGACASCWIDSVQTQPRHEPGKRHKLQLAIRFNMQDQFLCYALLFLLNTNYCITKLRWRHIMMYH